MIPIIVRRSALAFVAVCACFAQNAPNQYILIVQGSPLGVGFHSREALRSQAAITERARIAAVQQDVRSELAARNITLTGSVNTVLNALFVTAPETRVNEMKSIPGVVAVQPQRRYWLLLNEATQLMNAPAGWNLVGGMGNAGKGIKIGIIDTGVEATNSAFQDSTLPLPTGYPLCTPGDCQFTNNKVIVARSYVRLLTADDPTKSTPDDYSARDRVGHGTATASCAAGNSTTGGSIPITFSGMVPKAYVGSYKVFGSPQVNDGTNDAAVISALEGALKDGMDIVNLSLGGYAKTGPLDTGAACGQPAGVACDEMAWVVENVTKLGMIVVASAGNAGPFGGTVRTPGTAPSAITVGASTNAHTFQATVSASDPSAPPQIQAIPAQLAFPQLAGAVSAPLIDVTRLGNDGFACAALPSGSLTGAFALIQRDAPDDLNDCAVFTKVTFAALAGATGVVFYTSAGQPPDTPDTVPIDFPGPAATIAHDSGVALKDYIDTKPGQAVTINAAGMVTLDASRANVVTQFSSAGPSIGNNAIKPDLVATGDALFMAGQTFDVLGREYSSTGFPVSQGTSFSSPITAGAAALVKQAHPDYTVAQIKSALVNTAGQDITQRLGLNNVRLPADVRWLGGGKLDAGAAVQATVTIEPATISFGAPTPSSIPASISLSLKNHGTQSLTLSLSIQGTGTNLLTLSSSSVTIAAGATETVSVTLSGPLPAPGSYSGMLMVNGSNLALHAPYLYVIETSIVDHLINLSGSNGFTCSPGQTLNFAVEAVDVNGVALAGQHVTFSATGQGSITPNTSTTNQYGIAQAAPQCGAVGEVTVSEAVGGMTLQSSGRSLPGPAIAQVVNAASFEQGKPVAPGSYITIFGSELQRSDVPRVATTEPLPLVIQRTRVTFDQLSIRGNQNGQNLISEPGHLLFSSPEQINLQVPWEFQLRSSAQVKVLAGTYLSSEVVTVPLAIFAPAFFEISGNVAAQDVNFNTIDANHPAHAGQTVILYANGLGPVNNQPASGVPALTSPLSITKTPATVAVGGQNATVLFTGLAPGYPALYQINTTLPQGLAPGVQPITVTIGGITSKTSHIPVQ